MKSFPHQLHWLIFYGAWLWLGILQAGLTELQDDEAYYWVYSNFLSFGYFDHPPMIALLIKMGYAIFPNELGVRLFPLLLNVLSLMIIEKLIDKKNPFLFYTIALSIAVLQISGFVAVPDIPLIFFTALFFLCYKRFLQTSSLLNTLILGLAIAALLYSKYHAVLIIFFTLLSNIKLLAKWQAWMAVAFAFLLFMPHILWQWEHNWVSFRYHLFESNVNAYKLSHTTDYILGQLLLPGPIAGFILLPAAFLYKPQTQVEKALKFTMIGIYAFFLLSSFRGKVEGNWTSPVIVALMVLAQQSLSSKIKWQQWLYRLLPVTLVLVLFARIVMMVDVLPVKEIQKRYHAWTKWPLEMKEKTKSLPVVFSNSYQRASKYWFYSGQMTYSQNDCHERRNNYNFWPIESEMFGKPIYFLDIYRLNRFTDSLPTPIGYVGYKYDSAFVSFALVTIEPEHFSYTISNNESLHLKGRGIAPRLYVSYLLAHTSITAKVSLSVFDKKGWLKDVELPLSIYDIAAKDFETTVNLQLAPGKYFLRYSIEVPGYNGTHNSEKIELLVK